MVDDLYDHRIAAVDGVAVTIAYALLASNQWFATPDGTALVAGISRAGDALLACASSLSRSCHNAARTADRSEHTPAEDADSSWRGRLVRIQRVGQNKEPSSGKQFLNSDALCHRKPDARAGCRRDGTGRTRFRDRALASPVPEYGGTRGKSTLSVSRHRTA